jgi:thiol-disulfide isomerase/thioredoxin
MTKPVLSSVFAILLSAIATSASAAETAPEFSLPAVNAEGNVKLSDFKGRVVYLDFWATWCPPCLKSFPWMNTLQDRYKEQGLSVVAVGVDRKRELIEEFLKQTQPTFTVVQDDKGEVAKAYKLRGMPTSYLIDREGNIVLTHMGFRTKDEEKLEAEIKSLLEKLLVK